MTSARAYDSGFYMPFSETPIYDRLVAERGRPDTTPIHVPSPDFAAHLLGGLGGRPALPALPALPSSQSSGPGYGSGQYAAPQSGQYPTGMAVQPPMPGAMQPVRSAPQPMPPPMAGAVPFSGVPAPVPPAAYGGPTAVPHYVQAPQVPSPRMPGPADGYHPPQRW